MERTMAASTCKKKTYTVTNWWVYNASLVRRGDNTLWVSEDVVRDNGSRQGARRNWWKVYELLEYEAPLPIIGASKSESQPTTIKKPR